MLQLELKGTQRASHPLFNSFIVAVLALVLALMLGACASEPPPEPAPVEPEPVAEQPKPQPPRPVYTIELDFPDGPVSFTSHCDYSEYLDKLRSVHSSDRNIHAVFEHIENQSYGCDDRSDALRDYLRNLDALD